MKTPNENFIKESQIMQKKLKRNYPLQQRQFNQ
jgi:hypothetical protein